VVGALIAGTVKSFITNALGGLSYGSILANAAAVLILFGFIKSALDQVGIATAVTGALLYATLAAVAGVIIVGVGGGLIRPMQHRWEDMLVKASTEKDKIAAQSAGSSAPTASYSTTDAYPVDPTVRSTGSTVVAPASGSETTRVRTPRP
jgi:high-affinity Fe2+/Pb2+ permease